MGGVGRVPHLPGEGGAGGQAEGRWVALPLAEGAGARRLNLWRMRMEGRAAP